MAACSAVGGDGSTTIALTAPLSASNGMAVAVGRGTGVTKQFSVCGLQAGDVGVGGGNGVGPKLNWVQLVPKFVLLKLP